MRKYIIMSAALCAAFAFSSCRSSESAYKKAYEKAKAAEQQNNTQTNNDDQDIPATVVTPLDERPIQRTTVVDKSDNVKVTPEKLTVINGSGLKDYSVVVGSFSVKANAEGLLSTLKSEGLDAQIAQTSDGKWYRVIAATFSTKQEAARSRDEFRGKYAGAWLLYNMK